MAAYDDILAANERYAAGFGLGDLEAPPARRFAVVTCMDARIDPARVLGLDPGDAHVLRNAGGVVTDDVLRSLAISCHLLGTREAFVVAHEGCGALAPVNEQMRERLGAAAEGVDFLPIADLDASVAESLRRIRESPLLPDGFGARGLVYDVRNGRVRPVYF